MHGSNEGAEAHTFVPQSTALVFILFLMTETQRGMDFQSIPLALEQVLIATRYMITHGMQS